jgi:hypothetical protein
MTESTMIEPQLAPATPDGPPLPGLFARVIGVITSPGETFAHVVRTPKVAGMLFLICLATALSQGLPQFTESGRAAALEMQVQQAERWTGQPVSDEAYAAMQQQSQFGAYLALIGAFVFVPFASVIMTAIFWAVFNTILGGTASFKHVMAVLVHSQVISTLSAVVAAPIMYARGQMSASGIANLGALIPLDETSYLAKFFGMIDLFVIWWLVVLAIGLATLYKRTTTGVATGLLVTYAVIALIAAYFLAG